MEYHTKLIEIYKITVADERHYREMFHLRISYHTSIILALLAATVAGFFKATSAIQFAVLACSGFLVTWLSWASRAAVRRIYQRFLESVRAREAIEAELGIRDDVSSLGYGLHAAKGDPNVESPKTKYWPFSPLYKSTWLRPKPLQVHKGGYFDRMSRLFLALAVAGALLGLCSSIQSAQTIMQANSKLKGCDSSANSVTNAPDLINTHVVAPATHGEDTSTSISRIEAENP